MNHSKPSTPISQTFQLALTPWMDLWEKLLDVGVESCARSLRRVRGFNKVTFPQEAPKPCWATTHKRFPVTPSVDLRLFTEVAPPSPSPTEVDYFFSSEVGDNPGVNTKDGPWVLVVTPQVNHSYIADFSPSQSLVRTLLENGAGVVAVTDWLPPPSNDYSIDDSIQDIYACIECLHQVAGTTRNGPNRPPVHLVGLCQGGWQVAIATALRPQGVGSLTLAAAPIDAHVGSTPLHAYTLGLPYAFFEGLVKVGGGRALGKLMATGFDTLKPFERFVYNNTNLFLNGHDAEFVERYSELRNWYRLNKDLSGKLYLEAVRDLFIENNLAKGKMKVLGEPVDLSTLTCPLFLLGGNRDHITPPEQVFALAEIAPNAPSQCHRVDAGHIGVFMGRRSLRQVWPDLVAEYQRAEHFTSSEKTNDLTKQTRKSK